MSVGERIVVFPCSISIGMLVFEKTVDFFCTISIGVSFLKKFQVLNWAQNSTSE